MQTCQSAFVELEAIPGRYCASLGLVELEAIPGRYCASLGLELLLWVLQRHILPYSPSRYVALALRLHRLVVSEVNPWAFFKLVDKASYRLGLWLQFLFPRMRYLYLTRIVSASGGLSHAVFLQCAVTAAAAVAGVAIFCYCNAQCWIAIGRQLQCLQHLRITSLSPMNR